MKPERPAKAETKTIYSGLQFPIVIPVFSNNGQGGSSLEAQHFIVPGENILPGELWESLKNDSRFQHFLDQQIIKDTPFSRFEEASAFGKVNKKVYIELLAKKPTPIAPSRIFGLPERT